MTTAPATKSAPKRKSGRKARLLVVAPPPPAEGPDAGLWGPLETYQYPNYIKHLRRIKDDAHRKLIRQRAQMMSEGVLGVVDRAIELATSSMETKKGATMVLEFAAQLLSAAEEPKPVELKAFDGGPPPPPSDEARVR